MTIESAGVVFTAVLRLGVHAGFALDEDFGLLDTITPLDFGAGIEVGVFANVAELTTNVTYQADDDECDLGIEQAYTFGLGAAAGATFAIGEQTWGPVAETTKPIFYTTMASACAVKPTPTASLSSNNLSVATTAAERRDVLSTATITTAITYTGVACMFNLINCPASLQKTSQSTSTTTFTTLVPSGTDEDEISLGASVSKTVATTVSFGKNARKLIATSGSPVSYVPPPPTSTTIIDGLVDDAERIGKRPLVIGVSAGLGGAFLLAIVAGCMYVRRQRPFPRTYLLTSMRSFVHRRRHRHSAVPRNDTVIVVGGEGGFPDYGSRKGSVQVSEARSLAPLPRI